MVVAHDTPQNTVSPSASSSSFSHNTAILTNHFTAPLVEHMKIKYTDQTFNGTFMKEDIYRQPGSPEVDAAWAALGVDGESFIPSSTFDRGCI